MNEYSEDKIIVKCRHYEKVLISSCMSFNCKNNKNHVNCKGDSYVDWVFYLVNKQHLIKI